MGVLTKKRRNIPIWTMSTTVLRNFCHGFRHSVSWCWGMEHCYSSLAINGSSLESVYAYQWTTDVGLGPMRLRPAYCRHTVLWNVTVFDHFKAVQLHDAALCEVIKGPGPLLISTSLSHTNVRNLSCVAVPKRIFLLWFTESLCFEWKLATRPSAVWATEPVRILCKAWTGPVGSRRLRLPDFKTIGIWRW
jgi:hypothetical protein